MHARALHLTLPSAASAPVAFAAPSNPGSTSPAPFAWLVAPGPARATPLPLACEASQAWRAERRLQPLPPATLPDARAGRDQLARLLSREHAAAAAFLVALSDFDRRRGWEALGHANLFAFLTRELRLSRSGAFFRLSAARLVARFPAVLAALEDGHLCLTSVAALARVLTEENQAEVLPRFFGCSSREANEVAAALAPRPDPARRTVVTAVEPPAKACPAGVVQSTGLVLSLAPARASAPARPGDPDQPGEPAAPVQDLRTGATLAAGRREEEACPAPVQSTGLLPASPPPPAPAAALVAPPPAAVLERPDQAARASQPDEVEPLTAELRRLHVTVSRRFLSKLATAHDGLSHALPGATTEQVLEAALDLLLERQASRRGLVNRPSRPSPAGARECTQPAGPAVSTGEPGAGAGSASKAPGAASRAPGNERTATPGATQAATQASTPAAPPASRHIPAAVRREVWLRDGQRCQHPLDAGGTCGSTMRLELDHLVPLALGGPPTAENLRVTCSVHNRAAARTILGEALAASGRGGRNAAHAGVAGGADGDATSGGRWR